MEAIKSSFELASKRYDYENFSGELEYQSINQNDQNNQRLFDVIITYDEIEQLFFDVYTPKEMWGEEFLQFCFSLLDIEQLKKLTTISICEHYIDSNDLKKKDTQKFFFNQDNPGNPGNPDEIAYTLLQSFIATQQS
jgi:hypothetical protein